MRRSIKAFVLAILAMLPSALAAPAEPMRLVVDGHPRTSVIERPAAPGPRPTIILLHGAGGSGADLAQSEFGRLAPQAGFVAVFPDGRANRWNHLPPGKEATQFGRVFDQHGGAPDDVAFLKALVAELVRRGLSDPKRIYLAGISAGGIMTLRMVCLGEPAFAAIALIVAAMPEATAAQCRLPKPLPALMISGTADDVLPYGGGPTSTYRVWPAERLVAHVRQHNGCAEPAETSVLPGPNPHRVEVERSTRCSGGRVDYYRMVGGGHHARLQTPSPSQVLVDFFRDQAGERASTPPVMAGGTGSPAPRPATATPAVPSLTSVADAPWPPPLFGLSAPSAQSTAAPRPAAATPATPQAPALPSVADAPWPPPLFGLPVPAAPSAAATRPAAATPATPQVAALPPATAPGPPQARVALVIGNGDYRHAVRLTNPANDATDVAQALRRLGFDVIEGRDLDKRGMEDKLREFGRKLDRAELALFFYAGHGMQVAGRNYLIPVDAKLERPGDLSLDTIEVGSVLAPMEAERRVNLVFLDACRDNPLARSLGARSTAVASGLATIQSAIGTMIAFATQPDAVAHDGDGRNSPFTTALLKHLPTPGLDIAPLMRRVRADVIAATREKQVPWDHSSLVGEVILAR